MTDHADTPHAVKIVAVTGAGRGIGRALCEGLARRGYTVAALARQLPLDWEAPGVHAFEVDVADAAMCTEVFGAVAARLGPVDALVANAAVYRKGWFLDQSPEDFGAHFLINVLGVANAIRPVLPGMLERNCGRIVAIGSQADMNPFPSSVAYAASKGGLHPLVKGIAGEVDHTRYPNVLINELFPGVVKTRMSPAGTPPERVLDYVLPLIEAPSGGPHGQAFKMDKVVYPGESWKAALKRVVLGRGR
ncbi:SDR family oxidoreductase [Erythrobacter donghaensis]|uniref:SDR family oxidoreductase n=1 Tax=Erythrobacter donghaensis TaxID=267135 RepID=UPI00093B36C2|nr:SDR family oxidoreductase [Erythrobacter donghaensis]